MARFCMFFFLTGFVVLVAGWLLATSVLGLEGLSAALMAVVVLLAFGLVATIISRQIQRNRVGQAERELARRDENGEFVHLEDQTAKLKRLTGLGVGFLVTPDELAKATNDDLVGAVGIAIQLQESAQQYGQTFGAANEAAMEQASASGSVATQVQDLYGTELRNRGWSDQRIRRSALSAVRMARMVARRRGQNPG